MSQVTQPRFHVTTHAPSTTTVVVGALLALAATVGVLLVLSLGGASTDNRTSAGAQSRPALRSDGGPDEATVALGVGGRAAEGPNEANVAAAVGSHPAVRPQVSSGPSESRTAASIGGGSSPSSSAPDESRTAASISGR